MVNNISWFISKYFLKPLVILMILIKKIVNVYGQVRYIKPIKHNLDNFWYP